jgi:hypothetical protein
VGKKERMITTQAMIKVSQLPASIHEIIKAEAFIWKSNHHANRGISIHKHWANQTSDSAENEA